MLKKPGEPTPFGGASGASSAGRVVRIVVGTSEPGVRLKNDGLKVLLVVKRVTCNFT